jgi:hypothetical protein
VELLKQQKVQVISIDLRESGRLEIVMASSGKTRARGIMFACFASSRAQ